jgi:serine/threonine protein kinase
LSIEGSESLAAMDWIAQQRSSSSCSNTDVVNETDNDKEQRVENEASIATTSASTTFLPQTIISQQETDTTIDVATGIEAIMTQQNGETMMDITNPPEVTIVKASMGDTDTAGTQDINDPQEAATQESEMLQPQDNLPSTVFTSDTAATLSQQHLYMAGTSYSHMSVQQQQGGIIQTVYGRPIHVNDSNGSFPNVASILGPYFCLGQLGKGTFSSIHKCIDMQYYYQQHHMNRTVLSSVSSTASTASSTMIASAPQLRHQVVAAKVELSSFQQSGVLESEATMLDYLDRHVQPHGTVPAYVGHYRSEKFAAILMEFLPGEDMYQIRERIMALNNSSGSNDAMSSATSATNGTDPTTATRRISIEDAVYLTADVMLPLLRSLNECGVVHRDVKPSNCVRKNENDDCKEFCIVDFGLSKSIIVAENSDIADLEHPWIDGNPWMKPLNYSGPKAFYRKERSKAEFRGTSMYASLRVHQEKDYCARDDMWSLLYVFCDLVSGGLPWMSMAASKDRSGCQKMKEWVHGETRGKGNDGIPPEYHIDELLKGDLYHLAKSRQDREKESRVEPEKLSAVPAPLKLSLEPDKVFVLQQIFQYLASLQFWDMPDYNRIQSAIRYFKQSPTAGDGVRDPDIPMIDWSHQRPRKAIDYRTKHWWSSTLNVPEWIVSEDDNNRIDDGIFDDVDSSIPGENDSFRHRLPMELQYHLAQMDFNLCMARDDCVPMHRALHDWMKVVLPLLHHEWNSRRYEAGGHRTATDGFKRPSYLELLHQCLKYANAFENFQSRDAFYENELLDSGSNEVLAPGTNGEIRATKRRKVLVQCGTTCMADSDFIFVSKTLFGLEHAIRVETSKKAPPPVRISFG